MSDTLKAVMQYLSQLGTDYAYINSLRVTVICLRIPMPTTPLGCRAVGF
jgi:hypothetical protein